MCVAQDWCHWTQGRQLSLFLKFYCFTVCTYTTGPSNQRICSKHITPNQYENQIEEAVLHKIIHFSKHFCYRIITGIKYLEVLNISFLIVPSLYLLPTPNTEVLAKN